jgi:LacI family transcriptional regulator
MSTIHEVAKLSGVSVSTVSRVFNGYEDVSAATRERVLAFAKQLDYAPSAAARTLVKQRSQLIGVILYTGDEHPDIQHPFFQEVLVALKRVLGAAGYDLLLFATEQPGTGDGPHSYLRRARHHRVDGVVLMGVDTADDEVQRLLGSGIPTIGVDLQLDAERASHVTSDNVGGARLAVEHLAALGHTRIATIAGPLEMKPGRERLDGYRDAVAAAGLELRDEYVVVGDFYTETGEAAMRELLALPEPPTAVFAASDLMAVGALRALDDAALRCPDDVALVGYDDVQIAGLINPSLTTIRQDKLGLGAAAAQALVAMIEQPDRVPPVQVLPVELVVRQSSGAREGGGSTGKRASAGT